MGGGSRSEYWLKVLATTLGFPLDVPLAGEFGAALGAARLGRMAATGAGAEIATPPAIARSVDPDLALIEAYAEKHRQYVRAYGVLKEL